MNKTEKEPTTRTILIAFLLYVCAFLILLTLSGFTSTFDTATPAGSDDPREADDRMREIKEATRERLDIEHFFELTGTEVSDSNTGYHRNPLNVMAYATGDGATDDRTALFNANAVGRSLVFPPGTYKVSSDLTLSMPCEMTKGAILAPDTGVTITITGWLDAGAYEIFSLTGTGKVELGVGSVGDIYIQWWEGDAGDGSTDCATATTNAVDSIPDGANGGTIRLIAGVYKYESQVDIDRSGVKIIGVQGGGNSNLDTEFGTYVSPGDDIAGDIFKFTTTSSLANNSSGVHNLAFRDDFGTGVTQGRNYSINSCIHVHNAGNFQASNLWFERIKGSCIKETTAVGGTFVGIYSISCGDTSKPSIDLDSAAAGVVQGQGWTNLRIEVSYLAANLHLGTTAASNHFSNFALENANTNANTRGEVLNVAGFKNTLSGGHLNAHHGDGQRASVTGNANVFSNIAIGLKDNGSPTECFLLTGAVNNIFSNIVTRETVAADGNWFLFKLTGNSDGNIFSAIALNKMGGWDISSDSSYNVINGVKFENPAEQLITVASTFNRFENIVGVLDTLASGDLVTLGGAGNFLSITADSLDGVDNAINVTGDRNTIANSFFASVTNVAILIDAGADKTKILGSDFGSNGTNITDNGTNTVSANNTGL